MNYSKEHNYIISCGGLVQVIKQFNIINFFTKKSNDELCVIREF